LIKIIKADENLQVQTHPDDAYARQLGDAFGKILRAEEGYEGSPLLNGKQLELRLFTVHGKGKVVTEACLLTCLQGQVTLKSKSAELSLAPTDTILVPACIGCFEMQGEGEVVCAKFIKT
jgi:mannose-6-phosphate isomerase class I